MEAVSPAPEALLKGIQDKLQRWSSLGEAPEYYDLKNRCASEISKTPPKPNFIILTSLSLAAARTSRRSRTRSTVSAATWARTPTRCCRSARSRHQRLADRQPRRGRDAVHRDDVPEARDVRALLVDGVELGSRVIINLTRARPRRLGPEYKRERYWPPLEDVSERQMSRWPVRPYTIGTEACEQVPALLRYTIELRGPLKSGDKPADAAAAAAAESQRPRRIVYLYWYSRWVDFPSSSSIGSMAFYSNAWSVLHIGIHIAAEIAMLGPEHWAVCHCSAGVGRTGTFLALLHLLTQLPSIRDENELDAAVTLTIENMREKRLWMVKTDIEFATLYAALLLRLRNPEDKEFALTWPLKEGQRAPLIDKRSRCRRRIQMTIRRRQSCPPAMPRPMTQRLISPQGRLLRGRRILASGRVVAACRCRPASATARPLSERRMRRPRWAPMRTRMRMGRVVEEAAGCTAPQSVRQARRRQAYLQRLQRQGLDRPAAGLGLARRRRERPRSASSSRRDPCRSMRRWREWWRWWRHRCCAAASACGSFNATTSRDSSGRRRGDRTARIRHLAG